MREYSEGAYFVSRKSRRPSPHMRRGAGILVLVLILLTAGICLLVVFLPRLTVGVSSGADFSGKTFYFLTVGEYDGYSEAAIAARDTVSRGGAGYIHNDGKYKIVAAVYERETDAAALASVNDNAKYFALSLPAAKLGEGDGAALKALSGEWFTAVFTAATELDRGNATEAAAEASVIAACRKLLQTSSKCGNAAVARAVESASDYSVIASERPTRSTLSYLRYLSVRGIMRAAEALGAV